MPYDPELEDQTHADLYHHADDGRPLTDEEWDAQREHMQANGTWPF